MTGTVSKQEVPSPVLLPTLAPAAPYWLTKRTGREDIQFAQSQARSTEERTGEWFGAERGK